MFAWKSCPRCKTMLTMYRRRLPSGALDILLVCESCGAEDAQRVWWRRAALVALPCLAVALWLAWRVRYGR